MSEGKLSLTSRKESVIIFLCAASQPSGSFISHKSHRSVIRADLILTYGKDRES